MIEPEHDKTNKIPCAPQKDSEFSLCAQWAKDPRFIYAGSKDSDQRLGGCWFYHEEVHMALVLLNTVLTSRFH